VEDARAGEAVRRVVWLAIMAVSFVPVALLGFFANPLLFLILGPESWRERLMRLYPFRWWLGLSLAVCAFATAVYGATYGL
jgi:hypothetical protein